MATRSDNKRIREIVRGSERFDEVRACFEDMASFNVGHHFGHAEGLVTVTFADPHDARAAIEDTLANALVEAKDLSVPGFARTQWLWKFRVDRKSRRRLFDEHLSILDRYELQSQERMDRLLDLWIEAFYVTVDRAWLGAVDLRGIRVDLSDRWRGRVRQVVCFEPGEANVNFDDRRVPDLERFAAALMLAIGQTFQNDGQLFRQRPVQVGNIPDLPSLAEGEGVKRRADAIAKEARERAHALKEDARLRAEKEEAERERQSARRLQTVGAKYRDDVEPKSLNWRSASPDQVKALVWEHPTSTLAVMFGVSDVAISKFCRRHGIDKPPRGYLGKERTLTDEDWRSSRQGLLAIDLPFLRA